MPTTWDEAVPQDTRVAFPIGAGDMRQVKADVRDILNTGLSNNAVPTPPATLANYDSQIPTPGPGVVPAPLRWNGANVDLRGCTWRSPAAVTNSSDVSISSTSFANVASLQLIITPVSAQSLLIFVVQGMFTVQAGDAADTRRGQIRVRNTTGASDLTPTTQIQNIDDGGASNINRGPFTLITTPLTGISGATTFDVRAAVASAATTMHLRGDLEPTRFFCVELV